MQTFEKADAEQIMKEFLEDLLFASAYMEH